MTDEDRATHDSFSKAKCWCSCSLKVRQHPNCSGRRPKETFSFTIRENKSQNPASPIAAMPQRRPHPRFRPAAHAISKPPVLSLNRDKP